MNEQNTDTDNWRDEINDPVEAIKLKDGEKMIGYFKDEGNDVPNPKFEPSVVFSFLLDGEEAVRKFYVRTANFDLLTQIKSLGKLTGLHVEISRTGSDKADTRYTIKVVDETSDVDIPQDLE